MPSPFLMRASVLALIGAAGCTTPLPRHEPASSSQAAAAAAATSAPPQPVLAAATSAAAAVDAAPTASNPAPDPSAAVMRLLAYADRVRSLTPTELGPELSRLNDARSPGEHMQQALALAQLRQTSELIRAQDLLTRVLANASPEAMAYHPLARLLATRFGEQRRFEDLFDKQVQQTRETQRRLDQTVERLEALKAIERSLGARVPAMAPPLIHNNGKNPEKPARPRSAP